MSNMIWMICNYEFMMNKSYDTLLWYMQKSKFYVNVAVSIFICTPPPLIHSCHSITNYYSSRKRTLDHSYKKTTLPKYHLFQKDLPTNKGFQDEKVVPVVAKAVRRGFFRHSSKFLPKKFCIFCKKLVAFLLVFLKGGLCLLTLSRSSLIKSKHWKSDCFKFQGCHPSFFISFVEKFMHFLFFTPKII